MSAKHHSERPLHSTASASALGWASIGIGLTELAAPNKVQNLLGIDDTPAQCAIVRILGLREIGHGIGILTAHDRRAKARAISSRVFGDILDTAVLGLAATKTKTPARFAAVASAILSIGLLDMLCAKKLAA